MAVHKGTVGKTGQAQSGHQQAMSPLLLLLCWHRQQAQQLLLPLLLLLCWQRQQAQQLLLPPTQLLLLLLVDLHEHLRQHQAQPPLLHLRQLSLSQQKLISETCLWLL